MKTLIKLILIILFVSNSYSKETFEIQSLDGLEITIDKYQIDDISPIIILFHQAGWSRGEYKEIAPKLNKLGFNCLAVDQRSGGSVHNIANETNKRALEKNLQVTYTDAMQDMVGVLKYVRIKYKDLKIIAWGSSYSSALILKIAGDSPELCDAVLSFAPGEYFVKLGKAEDWITKSAKNISCPVFITSAKDEHKQWKDIYTVIPEGKKHMFLPKTRGNHGSRALWEQFSDSEDYWKEVKSFLSKYFN